MATCHSPGGLSLSRGGGQNAADFFQAPPLSREVVLYALWLYFRFTMSLRDVEELLAQRGIDVSYETVRAWTIKFGPLIARQLKRLRPAQSPRWHLDEVVCSIGSKRAYLWRAVDDEGEVLDLVVQERRTRLPPSSF